MRLSFKRCGRFAARLGIILLAGFGVVFGVSAAHAQDATWNTTPGSADFNTAANWTPATVPTGTASFGTSSIKPDVFYSRYRTGGFTFNPGASAYTSLLAVRKA